MSDKNVIQSTVVLTTARIEIFLGDSCIVQFCSLRGATTSSHFMMCNEKKAVVVAINEPSDGDVSVDIRMETGEWAGAIIQALDPKHLRFSGVYKHDKVVALGVTEGCHA